MATTRLEQRLTARDETGKAFRSLQANLATADRAFVNLTKVAVGLGAVLGGVFIRDLIEVNRKFQSLQASLVTFTGSTDKAKGAFDILKEFARTTPFALDDVVNSFNKLLSAGIKPTEKQLRNFADIAGANSRTISDFALAAAGVVKGQGEAIEGFGIQAKFQGEKVTLTFDDLTRTVGRNSTEITAAIAEIGAIKFAGGAERQAATLGGSFTNLRDNIDELLFSIGEAGFAGELSKAIKMLSNAVSGNEDFAKSISDKLVKAIYVGVAAIRWIVSNLDTMLDFLKIAFGIAVIRRVFAVSKAFMQFGKAVVASKLGIAVFNTVMKLTKGNLIALGAAVVAGGVAYEKFKKPIDDAIEGLSNLIDSETVVARITASLGIDVLDLEKKFNSFSKELEGTNEKAVKNNKTLKEMLPTVENLDDALAQLGATSSEIETALDKILDAANPTRGALKELALTSALLEAEVKKGTITQTQATEIMNRLSREALGLDTTLYDLKDRQNKLDVAFANGVISAREYEDGIKKIRDEMIDYKAQTERTFGAGAMQGVKDYFNSISDNAANAAAFTKDAFTNLEGALSEFFQTGKINFGSFLDALKRGLADLAAKAAITTGLKFLGDIFPSISGMSYDSTAEVGFADGGMVRGPGGPREDNILARLSSGEYVIKASSVNKFGRGFFDQLNAGRVPNGGISIPGNIAEDAFPGFPIGGLVKKAYKGGKKLIKGAGKAFDAFLSDPIGSVKTLVTNFDDVLFGAGAYDIAVGIATGDPKRIIKGIEASVNFVKDSIKNMINGIITGDPLTIAMLASSFILPGVGQSIMGALGPGLGGSFSGFMAGVTTGISNSFAAGILGSGSVSAIAASVGMELVKGAMIKGLSDTIVASMLPGLGKVSFSKSGYSQDRAAAFQKLYNKSAPYLARASGGPVTANDNVLVGEQGREMFIPNRNGTIAPIKSQGADLIGAVVSMKEEIVSLRRDMARMMSGQALAGARV